MKLNNSQYPEISDTGGAVRILHAVPDGPDADVYANDVLLEKNVAFKELTDYTSLPKGDYNITLYVTDSKNSPSISNLLTLNEGDIITMAIVGTVNTVSFLAIPDDNLPIDPNRSMLRFAQVSPYVPAIDITFPDGTVLFDNIKFKDVTPYISLPPQDFTLQLRGAQSHNVALTLPKITLEPNQFYTIYAIGLLQGEPYFMLALDDNI